MLSAAKHLLYLLENKQSRSFASLRMTPREGFFSNLLEELAQEKRLCIN